MEKKTRQWSYAQTIGDVFVEVKDLLKAYVQYVNNYNNALQVMKKLSKKDDWVKFADVCLLGLWFCIEIYF